MKAELDAKLARADEFEKMLQKIDKVAAQETTASAAVNRPRSSNVISNDVRVLLPAAGPAPSSVAGFVIAFNSLTTADERASYYRRHAHTGGLAAAPAVPEASDTPTSVASLLRSMNDLEDPAERAAFYNRHASALGL